MSRHLPANGAEHPGAIALDVHAHLAPLLPADVDGIEGVSCDAARGGFVIDGRPLPARALMDPAALLRWMDAARVARAWVSAPPPFYRAQLDATPAGRWASCLNAALRRTCAEHAPRLAPLLHLPLEHPAIAAGIVDSVVAVGASQVAGFAVAAGSRSGSVFSDLALDPLWTKLDTARAFVFIHPGRCRDPRLEAFYLENLVGNPHETAVAVAHLVFSGVPQRFPGISFCLAHGGGSTAMLAGRWRQGFTTARPGIDSGVEPPDKALRRFFVDCVVHDASALSLAAQVFGEDRLVFGSDWPFPMGLRDPQTQLCGVAPELLRRMLQDNPARILASHDHSDSLI